MTTVTFLSFGYAQPGHPPTAEVTYDLRILLRNLHHDPRLAEMTGLDQAVYEHVMATPGAQRLAHHAAATARDAMEDTGRAIVIAFGCIGGRHRSVALARRTHQLLHDAGIPAETEHCDVDRLQPVGAHPTPGKTASPYAPGAARSSPRTPRIRDH
ncbi:MULTISPECIES: RapZ C-terminal domain-containing protein [Streptomyces]|uniref:RapZ C-terminal domain-containing protein n=1 Tax=Streptomyces lycopersici TaxID=2974589 RepID=UPI0021CF643F|nr:RNase adapter RapZ [Streptomyces sp. NEAU-383]